MQLEHLERQKTGNAVVGQRTGAAFQLNTIADLRAFNVALMVDGMSVGIVCYRTPGDGGGGVFVYSASSVAANDNGAVIAPTQGPGRWLRQIEGDVNVSMFGAVCDLATDDSAAFEDAYNFVTSTGTGSGKRKLVCPTYMLLKTPLALTISGNAVLDLRGGLIRTVTDTGTWALTFTQSPGDFQSRLTILNGSFDGALNGGNGIRMLNCLSPLIEGVTMKNYDRAMEWVSVESGAMRTCTFYNNTGGGLTMTGVGCSNNTFDSVSFQQCGSPLILSSWCNYNLFRGCLFQATTSPYTIEIQATSENCIGNVFDGCWFESNGDGGAGSRLFNVEATAPYSTVGTAVKNCILQDTNVGGQAFRYSGTGTHSLNLDCNFLSLVDPIGNIPEPQYVLSTGTLRLRQNTVATLPVAAVAGGGALAYVTDANATTRLSVVAAGGANKVMVFCDGTNWLIL